MNEYKIIYNSTGTKPHGIRNADGFKLFFPEIFKYSNQKQRYDEKLKEQNDLAQFILNSLNEKLPGFNEVLGIFKDKK